MLASVGPLDEGAQHVAVWNARHVARGIEAGHRRLGPLVDPDAGVAVPRAEADFGDVHLHHAPPVVGAAPLMKASAARPFVGVQDLLDLSDGLVRQMIQLQEHRPVAAGKLPVKFQHHLAAPVVALDEAVALAVGGVAAQRPGDVGAGWDRYSP